MSIVGSPVTGHPLTCIVGELNAEVTNLGFVQDVYWSTSSYLPYLPYLPYLLRRGAEGGGRVCNHYKVRGG